MFDFLTNNRDLDGNYYCQYGVIFTGETCYKSSGKAIVKYTYYIEVDELLNKIKPSSCFSLKKICNLNIYLSYLKKT